MKLKFKIHPLFLPVALLLIISGKGLLFFYTFISVLLHEFAHYISAKNRGYVMSNMTVTPYGAVLSSDIGLPDKDTFFVCVAGPMLNIILALFTVALWWIFPTVYPYTLDFFKANIALGLFNILPLYPLDGSRMVLSITKNKPLCLKVLKIASIVIATICIVLFVISVFYNISYSLFLVALMLIFGVLNEGEKEKYTLIFKQVYCLKDFSRPIEKKELLVTKSLKIKKLLRELKNDSFYSVSVLDGNMKIKQVLSEEDLENMFLFDTDKTVGDFLSYKTKPVGDSLSYNANRTLSYDSYKHK